eukprot:g7598.t1
MVLAIFRDAFTEDELALPADAAPPPPDTPGASPTDTDASGRLLSNLHLTGLRADALAAAFATTLGGGAGCAQRPGACREQPLPARTAALRARFHSLLLRFAREVAAPLVGCAADDVAFQRYPMRRVAFPGRKKPHTPRHCDAQYDHQAGELNFWLPLTAVWAGNTLWSESAPGEGDYHPFVAGWGRCVRFWGCRARHKCVPNDTGFTRVSLDFRAMPTRRFDTGYRDSRGRPTFLRLGEYYRLGGEEEDEEGRQRATAAMEAAAAAAGGGVWARR